MKSSAAYALALVMAFTGVATGLAEEAVPPATPPLKMTEQRYNPAVCKPAVVKYFNDVRNAAHAFDPEKILTPEARRQRPDLYENTLRDGDVIHMAAYGMDRFADFEATMFNLQNSIAPGTAQDRATGETVFCGSLIGYSSAIGAAVSFQTPVKRPDEKDLGAGAPDAKEPTRIPFERYNVRACPAPVIEKFYEVTGKQIPNPHPMVEEDKMTPELAAAYNGAQIRTGMIRAAQAGMVFAMTEYADYAARKSGLDETQKHKAFCDAITFGSESLEYFMEKHMRYSDPKGGSPKMPAEPKKEI